MFLSLTDEQRAAKWDDEPWYDSFTGERLADGEVPPDAVGFVFSPRVECVPGRDPKPYLIASGPSVGGEVGQRRRTGGENRIWLPRPEFARPPVNRVLVDFRARRAATPKATVQRQAVAWLDSLNSMYAARLYPSDQIEHARKVLNRLGVVFS